MWSVNGDRVIRVCGNVARLRSRRVEHEVAGATEAGVSRGSLAKARRVRERSREQGQRWGFNNKKQGNKKADANTSGREILRVAE